SADRGNRRIQRTGALGLRVVKREPEEITLLSFPSRHPTAEMQRDIQFVYDTLKLKPNKGEILLSFGATQSAPNDSRSCRSMVEILAQIAAGIEVPPSGRCGPHRRVIRRSTGGGSRRPPDCGHPLGRGPAELRLCRGAVSWHLVLDQ